MAVSWNQNAQRQTLEKQFLGTEKTSLLSLSTYELREIVYSTLAITASYHVEKASEISLQNLLTHSFADLQMKCPILPTANLTLMELTELILDCSSKHAEATRVDSKKAVLETLNSMLAKLDPHSRLLDELETQELKEATQGEFAGIGVEVLQKDGVLSVMKVFDGSPAEKAGLKQFDEILAVNGKTTFTQSMDEIVEGMRGIVGSMADLLILHALEKTPTQVQIKRDQITVNSASLTTPGLKGFPVLKIESFSLNTANEAKKLLNLYEKKVASIQGLVLDLRGNPGGLLQQAVELADLFLDKGNIVSIDGYEAEMHSAKSHSGDYLNLPLVVLIDSQSASASEIVAGALQDNRRAIILGEKSFGKGSVQTVFELTSTAALKLTIARYYTPDNRSIQNLGIEPDIWLQSMEKRSENLNLLGETRLIREGLLASTLRNRDSLQKETGKTRYYLIDPPLEKPSSNPMAAPPSDAELLLSIAHDALSDCFKEGGAMNESSKLETISCINHLKSTASASDLALDWLKKRHNVDWSAPADSEIKIQSTDFMFQSEIVFNEESHGYELKWRLRNQTNEPKLRVAVFVSSKKGHFQNIEKLLGKVNPGEDLQGTFPVLIDTKETSQIDTVAGVSIDSHILADSIQESSKKIDRPLADTLKTFVRLSEINEKSSERAELEITVENPNDFSLQDIKLAVKSLAGEHLNFSEKSHFISEIPAKSSRTINIQVHSDSTKGVPLKFGIATQRIDKTLTRRSVYDFMSLLNKSKVAH